MNKISEQILAEALNLPPRERAELIEKLLSSFDHKNPKEIDALWARESEDRIDAFNSGKIEAIPAKEVFRKAENY